MKELPWTTHSMLDPSQSTADTNKICQPQKPTKKL